MSPKKEASVSILSNIIPQQNDPNSSSFGRRCWESHLTKPRVWVKVVMVANNKNPPELAYTVSLGEWILQMLEYLTEPTSRERIWVSEET